MILNHDKPKMSNLSNISTANARDESHESDPNSSASSMTDDDEPSVQQDTESNGEEPATNIVPSPLPYPSDDVCEYLYLDTEISKFFWEKTSLPFDAATAEQDARNNGRPFDFTSYAWLENLRSNAVTQQPVENNYLAGKQAASRYRIRVDCIEFDRRIRQAKAGRYFTTQ